MNANKELNIPKVDLQGIQAAQSEPDEKHIISLDGKLILSSDPIMIGKNFRTMTNLRYGKGHPEGIRGMSKINSSIINSTYYKARSAIQFTKQNPSEEHILAQDNQNRDKYTFSPSNHHNILDNTNNNLYQLYECIL